MTLAAFVSSFFPVIHGDAPDEKPANEQAEKSDEAEAEEDSEAGKEEEVEEEEEEPEDVHPTIRENCQNSSKCLPLTKHFQHCQEKVEGGRGYPHEDCVEELMMHCADNCAAPKLFSKLR